MDSPDQSDTPGQKAIEVSQNNMEVFKKPIQPAPRKKKKVLDEDSYVKEVEKIIERDFFPDLENLKDRLEYLDAREQNDMVKLRELYSKYSAGKETPVLRNVEESPATFETPSESRGSATPRMASAFGEGLETPETNRKDKQSDKVSVSGKEMSLDEFLQNHTSEDNESFEQIMEKSEQRFRAKYYWMFDAEEKHNKEHLPNLALPTAEQQVQASTLAITGTSVQNDTRPKQVENWKFETFNSVMFVPDAAPLSKTRSVELAKQKKREISLSNTRFEGNPFTETLSQAAMIEASAIQASKKEGKVGVDGKELGKDTPKVNGYSFVTAPSPIPGVDASPLMTWGEVEGTPFQLDGSQTPLLKKHTPGPTYRMPKLPNRERLGLQLAEKASQKHRLKKAKAATATMTSSSTPGSRHTPQSSLQRITSMSPAAQKLLTNKLVVRQGTDKALRASYTPSPSIHRGSSTPGAITPKTDYLSSAHRTHTPKIKKIRTPSASIEDPSPGLTDNLLNLPRRAKTSPTEGSNESQEGPRKRAADFF